MLPAKCHVWCGHYIFFWEQGYKARSSDMVYIYCAPNRRMQLAHEHYIALYTSILFIFVLTFNGVQKVLIGKVQIAIPIIG